MKSIEIEWKPFVWYCYFLNRWGEEGEKSDNAYKLSTDPETYVLFL